MVDVSDLYTKNGRPLQRSGDNLDSCWAAIPDASEMARSTTQRQVCRHDLGDRVVYQSIDSATIGSPSISANRVGRRANRVASAIWGDEPPFPD
jgi:hypothetical protein